LSIRARALPLKNTAFLYTEFAAGWHIRTFVLCVIVPYFGRVVRAKTAIFRVLSAVSVYCERANSGGIRGRGGRVFALSEPVFASSGTQT
jgi:hypothetical protein